MRRLCSAFAILAVAALVIGSAHAANEVYKWTDEAGVVQYSDAPPEGIPFERLNIGGSGARTEVPPPEVPVPTEAPTPPKPTTQSNCELVRRNLETFEKSQNISLDRDGDGTAELLDETQRAVEVTRNQELVKIYCGE